MALNNAQALLNALSAAVTANSKAVSRFGAQVVVMRKFIDATLPQLAAFQCAEISSAFRQGIEDAMSATDDNPLPDEYNMALLELTNDLLSALDKKGIAPG